MGNETGRQKLLLAVIQGDDYMDTVDELNRRGFFATILSSTGGFLKKRSVTLMIGVEESRVQNALDVLKQYAGRRRELNYSSLSMSTGGPLPAISSVPVQVSVGGAVVFIMDLDDIQKF